MNTTNQEPEKKYQFIQEKVISKRRGKIKKLCFSFVITLFLAVFFGIVARFTFIKAGPFLMDVLGLNEVERQQILIPSTGQEEVPPVDHLIMTPTMVPEEAEKDEPQKDTESQEGGAAVQTPSITMIEQRIDASLEDYKKMHSELKKLATDVSASLVTVTAVENGVDWFNDPYETKITTTGVFIGENNVDLLFLTRYDKVENADLIDIAFSGSMNLSGVLWDYDIDYNLAIIAVELKNAPEQLLNTLIPAVFGESYMLSLGTPIMALGNPNGYINSMELGMVTSKGSSYMVMDNRLDIFHTDISSNADSDGVIVNLEGEIIGLISHAIVEDTTKSVSTILGITRLKPMIELLANRSNRIIFGIMGEDIPKEVLLKAEVENGIYVTEVMTDSPAFTAGIRRGDIISKMDEYRVNSMPSFFSLLTGYQPEDTVHVTVQRMSKQVRKELVLDVIVKKKNRVVE